VGPCTPHSGSIFPLVSIPMARLNKIAPNGRSWREFKSKTVSDWHPLRAFHLSLSKFEMYRHPITHLVACWMMQITACL